MNRTTEISQNMSPDSLPKVELLEDGTVVTKVKGEGLVTCNLNSLVLNNVFGAKNKDVDLQRVVNIQTRMGDNVISLNRTVVAQATNTNRLYRAIGMGAMGLVTLLTDEGIRWESDDCAKYVGEIFKQYLIAMIKASAMLAQEKGSYPYFEGSDWETGEFFDIRGFYGDEWNEVRELASKGMRNG